jgi:hypothetical protein
LLISFGEGTLYSKVTTSDCFGHKGFFDIIHKKSRTALCVTLTMSHSAARLSSSAADLAKSAATGSCKDPWLSALHLTVGLALAI